METNKRITLAGYGPGAEKYLTGETLQALSDADLVIGSGRLLTQIRSLAQAGARLVEEVKADEILRILEEEAFAHAVCLFSGDSSFYSGADILYRKLCASDILFGKETPSADRSAGRGDASSPGIVLLPGISSLSAFCARLGIPSQDLAVCSAHGRECDAVRAVMQGRRSFFLTGGSITPASLCADLAGAGLGKLQVTVGERLSYPDERIRTMTAQEASEETFAPLSVMLADPAPAGPDVPVCGIPDERFVRGDVPMTKRFVRMAALSLLAPDQEDVCWDLGAGTGSVSVELARLCARVICVERDPEALRLLSCNRERFCSWNMQIMEGEIPEILASLPAPDRIFLGGGGRHIRRILSCVRDTRPRICAPAVTLETLQEVRTALEEWGYRTEITQLAVTQVRLRGNSHMMEANNPVFLILGEPV